MKRFAVISDIHGNYKALEAFLNYLENIRRMESFVWEIM